MTAGTTFNGPGTIDAHALRGELTANSDTLLVDVRTPGEYESGYIDGSVNLPLAQVDEHLQRIVGDAGGRMVLICQAGGRAAEAAGTLAGAGRSDVVVLEGGMNSWVAAGGSVQRSAVTKWAVERQVRLAAGGLVTAAIAGSIKWPGLRFVAGGIGAGLTYAAVSDSCAMGKMLMKLPYNRGSSADVEAAIQRLRR